MSNLFLRGAASPADSFVMFRLVDDQLGFEPPNRILDARKSDGHFGPYSLLSFPDFGAEYFFGIGDSAVP